MNELAEAIKSILVARQAMGVVLLLLGILIVNANRSFFRDVWNDPSAFWRIVARIATAQALVAMAWVTLFDDWLQLVAEPYRLSMKWDYQRVVLDPVDSSVRTTSVVLIGLALIPAACLFARHIGGYLMQIGTLALATLVWIPIFIMNQRLNAMFVQGIEASQTLPEVLGIAVFWVVRVGLGALTIAATLMTAMMLVALVCTVFLDLLHLREQRVTDEARGFFSELGRRADQHEDIPLKTLWRPIRRPM